jgi:hypothetical protein
MQGTSQAPGEAVTTGIRGRPVILVGYIFRFAQDDVESDADSYHMMADS